MTCNTTGLEGSRQYFGRRFQ